MNSRARVAEAKFSERLRDAYVRRDSRITDDRYSIFNSASLFAVQSRERSLLQLLKRAGLTRSGKPHNS
jgi:hypothetical protein